MARSRDKRPDFVEVAPGDVRVGDKLYCDGAFREVLKVVDCVYYHLFRHATGWVTRCWPHETVKKWAR